MHDFTNTDADPHETRLTELGDEALNFVAGGDDRGILIDPNG